MVHTSTADRGKGGDFSLKFSRNLDSLFSGNLEAVQRRGRKAVGGCKVQRAKQMGGAK